ncbi:hypothetical protein [Paenibacillus sp. FSL R7-0128]|uniref:hypothetical protein n=1 Tax=Paenibacillus sp. FSL R7-0128 TaxID=2954529 RepID=UPI0030F69126
MNLIKSMKLKVINILLNTITYLKNQKFKKKTLTLHNLCFNLYIHSDLYKDQINYLNHFIYCSQFIQESNITYKVYYIVDDFIFQKIEEQHSKYEEFGIVESFVGEFHKKYKYQGFNIFAKTSANSQWSKKDFIVIKHNEEIFIVLSSLTDNKERHLLRIIREAVLRYSEDNGMCMFHSAAVALRNKGILISGQSGSGKTTLMTHLITGLGAHFTSNDRVLLSLNDKYLKALYFPLAIRLGPGTVKGNSSLRKYIDNQLTSRIQIHGFQCLNDININQHFKTKRKYELTPLEFSVALQTQLCDEVTPVLIIEPCIRINGDKIYSEVLSADEKLKLFLDNCFTPYDESWKNPWIFERNTSLKTLVKYSNQIYQFILNEVKIIRLNYTVQTTTKEIVCEINKHFT